MGDDRFGVAQVGGDAQHTGAVDDVEGFGLPGLRAVGVHVEGQHRAAQPRLLAHRQFMLRVRFSPG